MLSFVRKLRTDNYAAVDAALTAFLSTDMEQFDPVSQLPTVREEAALMAERLVEKYKRPLPSFNAPRPPVQKPGSGLPSPTATTSFPELSVNVGTFCVHAAWNETAIVDFRYIY